MVRVYMMVRVRVRVYMMVMVGVWLTAEGAG